MLSKVFDLNTLKNFYNKYDRHIGTLTIIIGFFFDNLIIRSSSIDSQTSTFLIYISVAGISILLLHLLESRKNFKEEDKGALHFWVFFAMQFTIGSLFSMFFVFYSRGVSLATSWPFLLLLFANLIGNEAFKNHYSKLSLQVTLYFISVFSFSIYFLPVVMHHMSDRIFIYSGFLSLVLIFFFVLLLVIISPKRVKQWGKRMVVGVLTIYLLINVFYFTDTIPPVPLVMKDGGVYHDFSVTDSGDYEVYSENSGWNFFQTYPVYHRLGSEPVYVVTSVYAPSKLDTNIIHDWQYYDETTKDWKSASRIVVPIYGGREGGYRFYSFKQNLTPGNWRVNIETAQGQIVSRIKFEVVDATSTPELSKVIY